MKKYFITGVILILVLCITGCGAKEEPQETQAPQEKHTWVAATCTSPTICSDCGETKGEPLGHDWISATCTEPKKCSRCLITDGVALGHKWEDATCISPKTCSQCGATEGKALGHSWIEATCTESKKCSVCGETEGDPLGHNVEFEILVKESCSEPGKKEGTCSLCGEVITLEIPATNDHDFGDWKVEEKASCTAEGKEVRKCKTCGYIETKKLDKLAHQDDEKWVVVTKATSQEEGVKATHCKVCGAELQKQKYELTSDNGIPILKDTSDFKVTGSYTYTNSIWGYQYLVYVVEAKTTTQAEVKLVIKDKNGDILDTCEDSIALTKGKRNYFSLVTESKYIKSDSEYKMTTSTPSSYWSGAEDAVEVVKYNQSGNTLYITVKQVKEDVGSFAQLKMLFFNGDKLVDTEECYYSVYADELEKKGDEAIMSIGVYEKYTSVDFFFEDR